MAQNLLLTYLQLGKGGSAVIYVFKVIKYTINPHRWVKIRASKKFYNVKQFKNRLKSITDNISVNDQRLKIDIEELNRKRLMIEK